MTRPDFNHDRDPSVEQWRETIRKYIDREALHLIVGVYDNGDGPNESKN